MENKNQPMPLVYFWVDESKSTFQEFFEVLDKAFYDNAVRREKVFKTYDSPSMGDIIYLSLN